MNRKKILGIIFVIAALVCLHGFSTAMSREDGHTTKTMEQIEKAVFLQNDKVDKDNEGKPVIVRGKLHTAKSAHDTQLDLTFESAYVERRMETLGDNGKWTEEEDGSAAYFGKATLGEFKLSKDFLKDIKLTKGYTEFRNSELGDLTVKGKYVYESDTKRYQYSYIPDRKELTLVGTQNGKTLEEIRGIVVHYVANPCSTARENRSYFEQLKDQTGENATSASSHFVIGLEGEVVQCVPLTEVAYASNHRNSDTISIECCHPDETGKFYDSTYESLVELCAYFCTEFKLKPEDVIRHYDVTGKICPKYFVDHEDAWEQFHKDVEQAMKKK